MIAMRRSNQLLTLWAFLFAISGIIDVLIASSGQDGRAAYGLLAWVSPVVAYSWCKAHAREHNTAPPLGSGVLFAVLTPLAIPLYFFGTMRWASAFIALAKSIGVYVIFCLAAIGGRWMMQHLI